MVEVSKDLTIAYAGNTAFITNAAGVSGAGASMPGATPTSPVEKQAGSSEIAMWGERNDFPNQVMADVESDTVLSSGLEKITDMWYGGGLIYGLVTGYDKDGNEIFERKSLPEVDAFLNRSRRYAYDAFQCLAYFRNAFPEFILTKTRSQIYSIASQEAYHCRYEKPDKNGRVKNVYISANWPTAKLGEEGVTKVPLLDPYADTAETLRELTGLKYIYPISKPSPGKTLYQLASWNAIRRSGWLNVAKAIPKFKEKLFENQLTIKYLIEVHQLYWEWKYGDWQAKEVEERRRIIAEELEGFNKIMTGVEGAGKSVLTTTITDKRNNQEAAAFKVTAIDDKLKSGLYTEDSQEAAAHIMTALGIPISLFGANPGKGMGAGSGSDARVAFNNFISTSKFVQDLVLEPLHFVRDYNKWPANLRFMIKNPLIMTLDKGKQTQQETA